MATATSQQPTSTARQIKQGQKKYQCSCAAGTYCILRFGPVSLALWKDTVCAFYMFDRCGLISIFCLRLAL